MTTTATDVASYIEEQPEAWRAPLKKLRALCRRELRGYSECIAYGMPSYARKGQMEIAFGKQARYLSIYVLKQPVWSCPGLTDRLVRPRRRRCLDGCVRSTWG
jgi:uncharacterized protein YdhG (YjbR/CyaY superfamily)